MFRDDVVFLGACSLLAGKFKLPSKVDWLGLDTIDYPAEPTPYQIDVAIRKAKEIYAHVNYNEGKDTEWQDLKQQT